MRYHAYDEAPDYLRAEAGAQRRYERQKSNHPLCDDPEHPGCKRCEEQPMPEGHMTIDEFMELRKKQLTEFEAQHQNESPACEVRWAEREIDWLSTWGMK